MVRIGENMVRIRGDSRPMSNEKGTQQVIGRRGGGGGLKMMKIR
jgi:hypothetical protein